jgi:hypothetical protein
MLKSVVGLFLYIVIYKDINLGLGVLHQQPEGRGVELKKPFGSLFQRFTSKGSAVGSTRGLGSILQAKDAAAQTPEPKTLIYTYIQGFGRGSRLGVDSSSQGCRRPNPRAQNPYIYLYTGVWARGLGLLHLLEDSRPDISHNSRLSAPCFEGKYSYFSLLLKVVTQLGLSSVEVAF